MGPTRVYRVLASSYEPLVPRVEAYFTSEDAAKAYAKAHEEEGYRTEILPESIVTVAGQHFVLRSPIDLSASVVDQVRKDMLKKASPVEKRLLEL